MDFEWDVILKARQICADYAEKQMGADASNRYANGDFDTASWMRLVCEAIVEGVKMGKVMQ